MIQHEEALIPLVRTRKPLVKAITYIPGIFMLYYQESITKLCKSVPESIMLNYSLGFKDSNGLELTQDPHDPNPIGSDLS